MLRVQLVELAELVELEHGLELEVPGHEPQRVVLEHGLQPGRVVPELQFRREAMEALEHVRAMEVLGVVAELGWSSVREVEVLGAEGKHSLNLAVRVPMLVFASEDQTSK